MLFTSIELKTQSKLNIQCTTVLWGKVNTLFQYMNTLKQTHNDNKSINEGFFFSVYMKIELDVHL